MTCELTRTPHGLRVTEAPQFRKQPLMIDRRCLPAHWHERQERRDPWHIGDHWPEAKQP